MACLAFCSKVMPRSAPDTSGKEQFKAQVLKWAGKLDVEVRSLALRPMSRKWASCSSSGYLVFNEELLGFRPEVASTSSSTNCSTSTYLTTASSGRRSCGRTWATASTSNKSFAAPHRSASTPSAQTNCQRRHAHARVPSNPLDPIASDKEVAAAAIPIPKGRPQRNQALVSLDGPMRKPVRTEVDGEPVPPPTGAIENRPKRYALPFDDVNIGAGPLSLRATAKLAGFLGAAPRDPRII